MLRKCFLWPLMCLLIRFFFWLCLNHFNASFDSLFLSLSIRDKMSKIPTLKQHPYSSHISKFEIFPSFRPDSETGVRASRSCFNSGMTVLKKTKGKRATSCDKGERSDIAEDAYEDYRWQAAGVDTKSWSRPWKRGRERLSGWENMDRSRFLSPLL